MKCCELLMTCCASRLLMQPSDRAKNQLQRAATVPSRPVEIEELKRRQTLPDISSQMIRSLPTVDEEIYRHRRSRSSDGGIDTWRRRRKQTASSSSSANQREELIDSGISSDDVLPTVHSSFVNTQLVGLNQKSPHKSVPLEPVTLISFKHHGSSFVGGFRSVPTTPHLPIRNLARQQQELARQYRSSYGLNDPPAAPSSTLEKMTPSSASTTDVSHQQQQHHNLHSSVEPSSSNASEFSCSSQPKRFLKLLTEGDVQLCRMTHPGTVISKILSSKFLRRWETHHLYLNDAQISSKTPSGFMEESVPYSAMKEISLVVGCWDSQPAIPTSSASSGGFLLTPSSFRNGQQQCIIRILLPEGSLLLQTNNVYVRDQWFHSIIWKKNLFRYHQITMKTTRQEVLLKEVKSMVELATSTPLQDHCIAQAPFQAISSLLSSDDVDKNLLGSQSVLEDLLLTLSPLLERQPPSREMCTAFSNHCRHHPRSSLVRGLFTTIVHRILKHNVDFGKNPFMRRFVQEYVRVLYAHNDGPQAVRDFVRSAHGEGSACPHPRVLPNLVAVCLAAVFSIYEQRRQRQRHLSDWVNIEANHPVVNNLTGSGSEDKFDVQQQSQTIQQAPIDPSTTEGSPASERRRRLNQDSPPIWDMDCYLVIINTISEFEDWRPGLAQLLQPVPFPDEALVDDVFIKGMGPVVGSIGTDTRCSVHQCVLGIREGKEGWFHVICPSSAACSDDGSLWASILKTLLDCCCRRKAFLASMTKLVGACQLLALRDHVSAQEALCLMLEWSLLEPAGYNSGGEDEQGSVENSLPLQVATTLQSTESGRNRYFELCDRQLHLKELQQKGGPKKLTLPNRSTDNDLSKMLLNCGSLGNLECLSLAFTQVTSACAQHLIKLPSLRYLNLWSTQFGDAGLQLISEHLHKLQVLNLCETPVTDKGLACLASMKSLRKLNLNSTTLSAPTFENLKQKLPSLQECDVRYTDAW